MFLDLTGRIFGRLTVVGPRETDRRGRPLWVCVCACGNTSRVSPENLKSGRQKSCGCLRRDAGRLRAKDLTGLRFSRLTVIKRADGARGRVRWECLCDCGNTVIVPAAYLTAGNTKSCGCLNRDSKPNKTHGMSDTRLYGIWSGMLGRCLEKNNPSYLNYGARGVSVCESWRTFENFCSWAMLNGYADDLTIDRIDNNGGYCPENCRWATKKMQAVNRRTSVFIRGKCLKEWAESVGIPYKTLYYRVRHGWDFDRAISEPVHFRH